MHGHSAGPKPARLVGPIGFRGMHTVDDINILHDFKDPELWELRYIPYSG